MARIWNQNLTLVCIATVIVATSGCALPQFGKRSQESAIEVTKAEPSAHPASARAAAHQRSRQGSPMERAHEQWRVGKLDECHATLTRILAKDPARSDARRLLADLYLEQGELEASEAELRTLIQQLPTDSQVYLSLGLLLEQTGRAAESQIHLRRASELDPSGPTIVRSNQPSGSPVPYLEETSLRQAKPLANRTHALVSYEQPDAQSAEPAAFSLSICDVEAEPEAKSLSPNRITSSSSERPAGQAGEAGGSTDRIVDEAQLSQTDVQPSDARVDHGEDSKPEPKSKSSTKAETDADPLPENGTDEGTAKTDIAATLSISDLDEQDSGRPPQSSEQLTTDEAENEYSIVFPESASSP